MDVRDNGPIWDMDLPLSESSQACWKLLPSCTSTSTWLSPSSADVTVAQAAASVISLRAPGDGWAPARAASGGLALKLEKLDRVLVPEPQAWSAWILTRQPLGPGNHSVPT
jgi:hypothetical protein